MTNDLTDRVVRTVDHQTGRKKSHSPESEIVTILGSHANYYHEKVRDALEEAVDEGRLVKDPEGYRLPDQ